MVAAAMPDHLLDRSGVFNIDGESYRMRAHRDRSERLRLWSSFGSEKRSNQLCKIGLQRPENECRGAP
jgi:hypothetical protein